jgi:hypothetical protein
MLNRTAVGSAPGSLRAPSPWEGDNAYDQALKRRRIIHIVGDGTSIV